MIFLFGVIALFSIIRLASSIWLQVWMDAGDGLEDERRENSSLSSNMTESELKGFVTHNPNLWEYQAIHVAILGAMMIVGLIKGFALAIMFIRGSTKLHEKMLDSVMRAPLSFFDSTPAGRVLNRFSKDMDECEELTRETSFYSCHFCSGRSRPHVPGIYHPGRFALRHPTVGGLRGLPLVPTPAGLHLRPLPLPRSLHG